MKQNIEINGRKVSATREQLEQIRALLGMEDVKLADMVVGDTFMLGEDELVVLEQLEGCAAVIGKNLLREREQFGENNKYDGSNVDKLCCEFADKLAAVVGEENLLEHEVDLTSDDGLKDYGSVMRRVSVLTADQYRRYVEVLDQHKIEKWQWLATPYSTPRHEDDRWVKCVAPSGDLCSYFCDGDGGVRPFLIFNSDIFVSI